MPLRCGHLHRISQTVKLVTDLTQVRPEGSLVVTEVRHEVSDIEVAIVAHTAGQIVDFIDTIAVAVDELTRLVLPGSQIGSAVHVIRHVQACQTQDSRAKIVKADQSSGLRSRFSRREVLELFGKPNDRFRETKIADRRLSGLKPKDRRLFQC